MRDVLLGIGKSISNDFSDLRVLLVLKVKSFEARQDDLRSCNSLFRGLRSSLKSRFNI
jgi:hypothetical protein